jgi:putative hydrolase of the HAD superfamily
MRRPALIFDFGNVVAYFDYTRACDVYGSRLGVSGSKLLDRLRRRGFPALLRGFETGRISSEEFSARFRSLAELEITHDEFAAAWTEIFWLNEPVAELLSALKARGYPLVLGSNTNALHASRFVDQFAGTLGHFDRLVLSHEIGHLKPSAEFYHECARAAGAPACDCLFIDDLAENVAGARAAGLNAIKYRDVWTLIADLTRLGVEVANGGG